MQTSANLLMLFSLLFGGTEAESPIGQAAELEKAIDDLEHTQQVVEVSQAIARQYLQQIRRRQAALETASRKLSKALDRAARICSPAGDTPMPDCLPPGARPMPDWLHVPGGLQPGQVIDGSERLPPAVHYFSGRSFEIPFESFAIPFAPGDNVSSSEKVTQVHLHASTDGKVWKRVATASGKDNHFTCTAESDGWHYFIVQVETSKGRFSPANVNLAPPGLRVCVDTVKPMVKLRAIAPQDGGTVGVEWEVSDANLDLRTLELSCSVKGSDRWVPLHIRPLPHAQFSWSPVGVGPFEVRVQVSDLAGNTSFATTTVTPRLAVPAGAGDSGMPGPAARLIHVKSKTFRLNYKTDNVGPSNVKGVEVWITRDTRMWCKYRPVADAPANGPYEVTVESSGRWGFTLRPVSGVGRGPKLPSVQQQPQIQVEVDDQPPEVVLHNVIVGDGADSGFIIVNWRATDRWLRAKPITIKYAKTKDGPWETLEANLENTGTHKCSIKTLPADLYEFFVRVEATDEAGNTAVAPTKDTVKVDLKVPIVPSIEVEVVGAQAAAEAPGR